MDREVDLSGGRVTPGVVRVGMTVRRPTGKYSPFVHALLALLADAGFDRSPRFHGFDDGGREILDYVETVFRGREAAPSASAAAAVRAVP